MENNDSSVLIFDVETTGTTPDKDQIIELCIQFSLESDADSKTWRIKPTVPIQPAAQAVHGISEEDLRDCPTFEECGEEILEEFKKANILVGYNVQFDISFLLSECRRVKLPPPDLSKYTILDPYILWRNLEPRSLAGAHQKFVGSNFDSAHSAAADVAATGRVLLGMLRSFKLEDKSWAEVAASCTIESLDKGWIGPTHHFVWEKDEAVFGFGKYRGRAVYEVARLDDGNYIDWMSKKDFPSHVMEIAQYARNCERQEFANWLTEHYPR